MYPVHLCQDVCLCADEVCVSRCGSGRVSLELGMAWAGRGRGQGEMFCLCQVFHLPVSAGMLVFCKCGILRKFPEFKVVKF